MGEVRRVYVEKKKDYAVKAKRAACIIEAVSWTGCRICSCPCPL